MSSMPVNMGTSLSDRRVGKKEGMFTAPIVVGVAAALVLGLDIAMVALWPLFPFRSQRSICQPMEITAVPTEQVISEPIDLSAPRHARTWEEVSSCFGPLKPSDMRLLPDAKGEASARSAPRWITFGLSSVKRERAEYLQTTLAHLYESMGSGATEEAVMVVHLADFDEQWIGEMIGQIRSSFVEEVSVGRLHVIHAPRRLYPTDQDWMDIALLKNKFGDNPKRQRWRSKQNLDYAFLMLYSAGLGRYYMQMEDDILVVPSFLRTVKDYVEVRVAGRSWVMISFSVLGFIGKMFDSSVLPKLSEFLLVFHDEAPCDWIIWTFIDILSASPVSPLILDDAEREVSAWQSDSRVPKPGMRQDLVLYYRIANETVFQNPGSEPLLAALKKPALRRIGVHAKGKSAPLWPAGRLQSNMKSAKELESKEPRPEHAATSFYPPPLEGEIQDSGLGFHTPDTCSLTTLSKEERLSCAGSKYIELILDTAHTARKIHIFMANKIKHPKDYIRKGELHVATQIDEAGICKGYTKLADLDQPEVEWNGDQLVRCLRLSLSAPQQEWVMLRGIQIETEDPPSTLDTSLYPWQQRPAKTTATSATQRPATGGVTPARQESFLRAERTLQNNSASAFDSPMLLGLSSASMLGISAGFVAWGSVHVGRQYWATGLNSIGEFAWWSLTFTLVVDGLLLLTLALPPPAPFSPLSWESTLPHCLPPTTTTAVPVAPPFKANLAARRAKLVAALPTQSLGFDWRALKPGIHQVPFPDLQILGERPASLLWMTVGIVVTPSEHLEVLVENVDQWFRAGAAVVLQLTDAGAPSLQGFIKSLRSRFSTYIPKGMLHVVHAPKHLYPCEAEGLARNLELAILFHYSAPLAQFHLQVEPTCKVETHFKQTISQFMIELKALPWNVIAFSKLGINRKIFRSHMLPRLAELLVMFPAAPADALIWDFVDLSANQTAPRTMFVSFLADNTARSDLINQYHNGEALIEHVGDVSSLAGKVQRLRETRFQKMKMMNTLFDNPASKTHTSLGGDSSVLQRGYGEVTPENRDNVFTSNKQNTPAGSFIELTFSSPRDIQIFSLQLGGLCSPTESKQLEPDFYYVPADAELRFGRGMLSSYGPGQLACAEYETVDSLSQSREYFWRSPPSHPATNINCIAVITLAPQSTPLSFRRIQVRSRTLGLQLKPGISLELPTLSPLQQYQFELAVWRQKHFYWEFRIAVAFGSGGLIGFCFLCRGNMRTARNIFSRDRRIKGS